MRGASERCSVLGAQLGGLKDVEVEVEVEVEDALPKQARRNEDG